MSRDTPVLPHPHKHQQYWNTSSPDGVLDPELQSAGLGALQPGDGTHLHAVRLLLLGLVHHGGAPEPDWTVGVGGCTQPVELSDIDSSGTAARPVVVATWPTSDILRFKSQRPVD